MNKMVNPEMVLLARESRGMTQKELAKNLDVSQAAISKAEKLPGNVSGSLLKGLSDILDYPESFFFQQEYWYAPATPLLHRKQKTLPQKIRNQVEAEANVRRIHIERLLDSIEIPDMSLPSYDIDDYAGAEEVAQAVRAKLKLPRGPIQDLTTIIERIGIIIVPCKFNTEKLDGFSIIVNGKPPVVYVNQDMPWCRIRFTLAHELGHIVLGHVPGPNIEDEANDFASAFLLPKDDISRDFAGERIDLHLLAGLKPRWKVSMQALLFKAKKLGYITDNQNAYLWMTMNQSGYRKREPAYLDIPAEQPKLLKAMIEAHLKDLEYSEEELLEMLATSKKSYVELYAFLDKKQSKTKIVQLFKS